MNKSGRLIISLDFELLWGVFDVVDYKEKLQYFQNTRKVIPEILLLFKQYEVHATWAIVGMLFNRDWGEWERNVPVKLPGYSNNALSPYSFINRLKETEKTQLSDLVFAPDLIDIIKTYRGQEIATHTYSHFYCLEKGQDATAFKMDLNKAIELAEAKNINLHTLIFPRNQIEREYLKICAESGIKNVRSNPKNWYWKNTLSENIFTKIARSGDAYFPFGKKTYELKSGNSKAVLQQPASRFLRPVESNRILRKIKLTRIKHEITDAAKKAKTYHLWWHPHNFGNDPKESLEDLKVILEHYKLCMKQYGLKSLNMYEHGKDIQY